MLCEPALRGNTSCALSAIPGDCFSEIQFSVGAFRPPRAWN